MTPGMSMQMLVDPAGQDVLHRRAAAAIGHVGDVDAHRALSSAQPRCVAEPAPAQANGTLSWLALA